MPPAAALWLTGTAWLPAAAWAEAVEDIRDIRAPKAVAPSWVLTTVLAGALLAAIVALVLWRWRRRRAGRRLALPWESALERLDAARPLMTPGTAREFGLATSEAIRHYIQIRFQVVATQRTTEEFLQTLLQGPDDALARHRERLATFLQACDLVKFAGASPAVADLEVLLQSARAFVLETRALPTEPSRP